MEKGKLVKSIREIVGGLAEKVFGRRNSVSKEVYERELNPDWSLSQRKMYAFFAGQQDSVLWEKEEWVNTPLIVDEERFSERIEVRQGRKQSKILTLADVRVSTGDRVFYIGDRGVSAVGRRLYEIRTFVSPEGFDNFWDTLVLCSYAKSENEFGRTILEDFLSLKDIYEENAESEWAVIPKRWNVVNGFTEILRGGVFNE